MIDILSNEIDRVEKLMEWYKTIPHGHLVSEEIKIDIMTARGAMVEGDIASMIVIYNKLKKYF